MQVNATLIAAQQAAREAQARFQKAHAPTLSTSFASALGETAKADSFSALPLKQMAAAQPESLTQAATPPANASGTRPGTFLDITI